MIFDHPYNADYEWQPNVNVPQGSHTQIDLFCVICR